MRAPRRSTRTPGSSTRTRTTRSRRCSSSRNASPAGSRSCSPFDRTAPRAGSARATCGSTPNRYPHPVERGAHQITVFDGDKVMTRSPSRSAPTRRRRPPGKYYLRVLLKAPDPNTVYGPYAYGLSGHSEVLTTFNGGDGEVGIHGNNDASVLGKSVTHGCVRISNDEHHAPGRFLPLGHTGRDLRLIGSASNGERSTARRQVPSRRVSATGEVDR